jgi:hypothetical protein
MIDFAVVLLGLFIGLMVGATGVGAGTLGAPFLIFLLKIDPFVAAGTDLFMSVVIKAVGSLMHKRANNVDRRSLIPLAISGVGGSLAGLALLTYLKHHVDMDAARWMMRHAIGVVLCVCALAVAFSSRLSARHERLDNRVSLGVMGSIVAAITAVTGVGVGSLSVPALYFIKGRAQMPSIVGTSLAYATIVTAVGVAGHMALGDVNYPLALLLLVGAVPGVAIGTMFVTRAPAALKPVVAALLVVSGLRLIA